MDNNSLTAFLPLIILLTVYILPIVVNRKLAIKKDRSVAGWIIAAFFLSWWSTLILACLPSKLSPLETTTMQSQKQLDDDLRRFNR